MEKITNQKEALHSKNLCRFVVMVCVLVVILSAVVSHGLLYNRDYSNYREMSWPFGISLDHFGKVYITYPVANVIKCYSIDGNHTSKWGSYEFYDGNIDNKFGITIDSEGYIYVIDAPNCRIQKFGQNGEFLTNLQRHAVDDRQTIKPCWQNTYNTCD